MPLPWRVRIIMMQWVKERLLDFVNPYFVRIELETYQFLRRFYASVPLIHN